MIKIAQCVREYDGCHGETQRTINGRPVCRKCKEKGELFDDQLEKEIIL